MQSNQLPADLAEIAGPLQEASVYEISSWQTRRGLYNFVTGLVMLLVAPVLFASRTGSLPAPLVWGAIGLAVVAMASFTALRRFSPSWEPVFADPRRRGIPMRRDRLRWAAFGIAVAYFVTRILQDEGGLSGDASLAAVGVVLLSAVLGLGARYAGDFPLSLSYWTLALFALPVGLGIVPPTLAMPLLFGCAGAVSFLVGAIRIATSRRTTG